MPRFPKNVLGCLDPDGRARAAMHQARFLTERFAGTLHYCQVVQQSRNAFYLLEPMDEAAAEQTGRRTFEMYGVSTHGAHMHVRQGNPAKEIVELTFDSGADLVVLGPHGPRGGTAGRIVGLSAVPVLMHAGDVAPYRRILVACDLSGFSDVALWTAVAWAEALNCEVSVVHVFETPDYAYGGTLGPELAHEHEDARLTEWLRFMGQGGLVPTIHRAEGEPVETILRVAEETQSDLVVVGSHGRTGLTRLLLGSVATRLIELERKSVLVVRGPRPSV
jgi:nucleotide-binding universal stress UspA family protein